MSDDRFEVRKMRDGGFIVIPGVMDYDRGSSNYPVFACAIIDDALRYVRDRLQPKKADAS